MHIWPYLYPVQRLGYLMDRRYLGRRCSRPPCPVGPPVPVQRVLGLPPGIGRPSVVADSVVELLRGSRRYELSDWLGNVRVVVTDRRLGSLRRGYRAEVVSVGDYYSFGAEIRARSYEIASVYRYGYQAQERDDEVYGRGASYYYRYRQQDARLGRFWSVDPLAGKYPYYSPYSFSGNRLVDAVEWEGLEPAELPRPDPQDPLSVQVVWDVAQDQQTGGYRTYSALVRRDGEVVSSWEDRGPALPPIVITGERMSSTESTPSTENTLLMEPSWMTRAYQELDRWQSANAQQRQRMIQQYLGSANRSSGHAWCAAFAYYVLRQSGVPADRLPARDRAAHASSWLATRIQNVDDIDNIPYGAVVAFDWRNDNLADHVGFFIGRGRWNNTITVAVVHGNWGGEAMRTLNINRRSVMGYFYPAGYREIRADSLYEHTQGMWPN